MKDENFLLEILERCNNNHTFDAMCKDFSQSDVKNALDKLLREDHILELPEHAEPGNLCFMLTAIGKIALREKKIFNFRNY